MKGNELVWRTIVDRALKGQRVWPNIAELAYYSGVPESTAKLALVRLTDIGAIRQNPRGGFSTINPEKVLLVFAARRSLSADLIIRSDLHAVQPLLDTAARPYALGGPDAAVIYVSRNGVNTVADPGQRIVYLPDTAEVRQLPAGDEVLVLRLDPRAELDWSNGYSSAAQTYADLFALPGWQADEFRRALHRACFEHADWEQRGPDE